MSTVDMSKDEERAIRNALTTSWVWLPEWIDSPRPEDISPLCPNLIPAGRMASFHRTFELSGIPAGPIWIHLTADTRYKLFINDRRIHLGPVRSDPKMWFYDSLDIAPYLSAGVNDLRVDVMRWFKSVRSGMPFARSDKPGFTLVGAIDGEDIGTIQPGWTVNVDERRKFPMGTGMGIDSFMHISEQYIASPASHRKHHVAALIPVPYGIKTLNGELSTWFLLPRQIPLPETTPICIKAIHNLSSSQFPETWFNNLSDGTPISLEEGTHALQVEFKVHSTAFIRFQIRGVSTNSTVKMKILYAEGYENQPVELPFKRSKSDRTDSTGILIGPEDSLDLTMDEDQVVDFEPFWFRTFRVISFQIIVNGEVNLESFEATQTNYPMSIKSSWSQPNDPYGDQMWEISIRTLRNCMFDGYSDCPFYEQLMYAGDSRSVALFHYFLSGDPLLMRQGISLFATSYTTFPRGGLVQSRFPSHVPQYIAGFGLYWIMAIADYYTFFADKEFVRPLLPLIDGILTWFESHVDDLGLVSGIEEDIWQYVDWVDTWAADSSHPDKGVPTAGRRTNRHTFFSMIYAYTLEIAATLLEQVGRGTVGEYRKRKSELLKAINTHCYDPSSNFYTDTTVTDSQHHTLPYISQHCQVFAVLSGTCPLPESANLLYRTFTTRKVNSQVISKASYVILFYAFRAISLSGRLDVQGKDVSLYDHLYPHLMEPWRRMIDNHLTTWEEDDVRQRSDCHAWGSVPIYEFSVEIAGFKCLTPGWKEIDWSPRTSLTDVLDATISLGKDLTGRVKWDRKKDKKATLHLSEPRRVRSVASGKDFGLTDFVEVNLTY